MIGEVLASRSNTYEFIPPVQSELFQDDFFGGAGFGSDMDFLSMDEMMASATANLDEVLDGQMINIFEAVASKPSDFDIAREIISANLNQFKALEFSIMDRAQQLQVACHPHGEGSNFSISNTSFTEVNLFKTSFDESEEEHKHCGNCGADTKNGSCPNCSN